MAIIGDHRIDCEIGDMLDCDGAMLKEGKGKVVEVTDHVVTLEDSCGRRAHISRRDRCLRFSAASQAN